MKFELDQKQHEKLRTFLAEQYAKVVAEQKKDPEMAQWITKNPTTGVEYPYFGAIGGSVTYQFTPTGLGIVVSAVFCMGTLYEAKIDLTAYEDW